MTVSRLLAHWKSCTPKRENDLKARHDDDLDRVIETPWVACYSYLEMIEHLLEDESRHRAELPLILGRLGPEGLNA